MGCLPMPPKYKYQRWKPTELYGKWGCAPNVRFLMSGPLAMNANVGFRFRQYAPLKTPDILEHKKFGGVTYKHAREIPWRYGTHVRILNDSWIVNLVNGGNNVSRYKHTRRGYGANL
jgi:hypothetical protein